MVISLQWCHNGRDGVSYHQPHHCLFNSLLRHRSKKTPRLGVTGLCAGNSPGTGEFPAQMASNAENVSVWWLHHIWIQPAHAWFYTQFPLYMYNIIVERHSMILTQLLFALEYLYCMWTSHIRNADGTDALFYGGNHFTHIQYNIPHHSTQPWN